MEHVHANTSATVPMEERLEIDEVSYFGGVDDYSTTLLNKIRCRAYIVTAWDPPRARSIYQYPSFKIGMVVRSRYPTFTISYSNGGPSTVLFR